MIDFERWKTFSKRDQLAHIASEIMRARLATDENSQKAILERAIDLISLSLDDFKWQDNPLMLLSLRNMLADIYIGKHYDLERIFSAI